MYWPGRSAALLPAAGLLLLVACSLPTDGERDPEEAGARAVSTVPVSASVEVEAGGDVLVRWVGCEDGAGGGSGGGGGGHDDDGQDDGGHDDGGHDGGHDDGHDGGHDDGGCKQRPARSFRLEFDVRARHGVPDRVDRSAVVGRDLPAVAGAPAAHEIAAGSVPFDVTGGRVRFEGVEEDEGIDFSGAVRWVHAGRTSNELFFGGRIADGTLDRECFLFALEDNGRGPGSEPDRMQYRVYDLTRDPCDDPPDHFPKGDPFAVHDGDLQVRVRHRGPR